INFWKKRHESPRCGIIYLSLNLTKGAFRVDVFLFCGEKPSLSFFCFSTQAYDVSISALNNNK
ncbi:TPA: hypothetical protein ACF4KX_001706, partial [Streptococcus pyogenes]